MAHADRQISGACAAKSHRKTSARAGDFPRARCDFVEGARWHRELPAQNANARRRLPKGIAGEWREILAARADVPILGKCGANLLKACAPVSQNPQIPTRFLHSPSGQGGNVAARADFQGLPANIHMSIRSGARLCNFTGTRCLTTVGNLRGAPALLRTQAPGNGAHTP